MIRYRLRGDEDPGSPPVGGPAARSGRGVREEIAVAGRLVLAGTPIGDSRFAAPILVQTLAGAQVIAAEDTRRLHTLLLRLGVTSEAEVISYFEGNETERTPQLVAMLESGRDVVLVTDAGMPSVSDPGYRLVRACIDAGIQVTAVPGPSAVLTALAVSGLPVDRFSFEGFAPRRAGERRRLLADLAHEQRTMIFFEAPHRLADFLTDAAGELGADRPAAICRELTKPFEEVVRGGLAELAEWAREHARGEITVVVQGAPAPVSSPEEALELVRRLVAGGGRLASAVAEVAASTGVRRKDLYELALADQGRP